MVSAILALAGCYEGFKHPQGGGNNGNGEGKAGGGGGDKRYGVVIVDVVRPSAEALTSPVCGNVPSSLSDVRLAEMDARVRGITGLLDAQADLLRVVVDEVSLTDCRNVSFASLEARATTPAPPPQVSDQVKAKLALNVRVVLWYGAGGNSSPSPAVLGNEWADMALLGTMGFARRLSVNYFAITGPPFGYMWNWKTMSDQDFAYTAAVVLNPLPSQDGIAELMTTVKKSAVEFSDWLGQKVRGL